MARSIAADDGEIWRAVMVYVDPQTGLTYTFREGAYAKAGTAKARITYHKNGSRRVNTTPGVDSYSPHANFVWVDWVDGWIERGNVLWSRTDNG